MRFAACFLAAALFAGAVSASAVVADPFGSSSSPSSDLQARQGSRGGTKGGTEFSPPYCVTDTGTVCGPTCQRGICVRGPDPKTGGGCGVSNGQGSTPCASGYCNNAQCVGPF